MATMASRGGGDCISYGDAACMKGEGCVGALCDGGGVCTRSSGTGTGHELHTRSLSIHIDEKTGDDPVPCETIVEPGTPESPGEGLPPIYRSNWGDVGADDNEFFHALMEPVEVLALAEAMLEDEDTARGHLNLSNKRINDKGAANLALLLQYNRIITDLDLSNNCIGPEGCTRLAQAIQQYRGVSPGRGGSPESAGAAARGLVSLKLSGNPIGEEGALSLAKMLCSNATIKRLDLRGAALGKRGFMALTLAISENNRTVEELDLSHLPHDGVSPALSEAEVTEALPCIVRMVGRCTSLTFVGLGHVGVGSLGFAALVEHGLQHNTTLQAIDLRSNGIREDAASALARLVLTNRTLKDVNLGCNRLGDGAAEAMAGVLPYSQGAVHLDLSYNGIADGGLRAVTAALGEMDRSIRLRLWGNFFSPRAARDFVFENSEAEKRARMKQYTKRKRPAGGSAPYAMPALKIRCTTLGGGGLSPSPGREAGAGETPELDAYGAIREGARGAFAAPLATISPLSTPADTPAGSPVSSPRGGRGRGRGRGRGSGRGSGGSGGDLPTAEMALGAHELGLDCPSELLLVGQGACEGEGTGATIMVGIESLEVPLELAAATPPISPTEGKLNTPAEKWQTLQMAVQGIVA